MRSNVLKVLESGAGFYIGTTYREDGMDLPYSRVSVEYYGTYADAKVALENNTYQKRGHP
jgi:hypothetical protein